MSATRLMCLFVGAAGLLLIFLYQDWDVLSIVKYLGSVDTRFIIKKFVRVILNDLCMVLVIYGWFNDRGILRLALSIQFIDTFVLLPLYLALKLSLEGPSEMSSPFLSQIHRLVVNPTLMMLLIPAIYMQQLTKRKAS